MNSRRTRRHLLDQAEEEEEEEEEEEMVARAVHTTAPRAFPFYSQVYE